MKQEHIDRIKYGGDEDAMLMHYKAYAGSVIESMGAFHGKLLGITDLVTYEADNVGALWGAFVDAVDDYLATCKELGKEPQKTGPFKS